MKFKNIGIIGAGPNCVFTLDILIKKILKNKSNNLKTKITIYEKSGNFGSGNVHSKKLYKNLLLNRVAGQLSLGSYPFCKFPKKLNYYEYDFLQWSKKNKINYKYTDWPPRFMFGRSLEQKFKDLIFLFKKETSVIIKLVDKKVLSVNQDNDKLFLSLENKQKIAHDHVLFLTGNSYSKPSQNTFHYKINQFYKNKKVHFYDNLIELFENKNFWFKKNLKKETLIYGMGVTGIDLITILNEKSKCKKIYCVSRTGLFPFARPFNEKNRNTKLLEHKGIIFNKLAAKNIKEKLSKKSIINFEKSIFKILKIEFYLIYFQNFMEKKDYKDLLILAKKINKNQNLNDKNISKIFEMINNQLRYFTKNNKFKKNFYIDNWFAKKEILSKIINSKDNFFDYFENPLKFVDIVNFKKFYLDFIKWDLKEAKKGNLSSSFKKASDGVWRDLRQELTFIVDDNSLNPKSNKFFLRNVLPIHNRMADGPSLEVINKITKLIKNDKIKILKEQKKIITNKKKEILFKTKSKYKKISNVFFSIISIFEQNKYNDPIIKNLINQNIVSLNKRGNFTQGIKLNQKLNPINRNNKINNKICFIGVPAEGIKFFHHTLSRPDKLQPNIRDIINWSNEVT